MTRTDKGAKFCRLSVAVFVAFCASQLARADTFFWTNIGASEIETVTTPSNTIGVVLSPSAPAPDSLIFNANGTQVIYTSLEGATPGVWEVNTDGTGNHQIATGAQLGGSDFVQDLALEPGGNSVLVSTTDVGKLFRINLTTNAVSLVATLGGGLRGITYDSGGDLFALTTGSMIEQINPITGAVINSHALPSGDGLTFDTVTGNLFAGGTGNQIFEIPTSLASVTTFTCAICSNIDGTESDNNGHIDLADPGNGTIEQFTIAGATFAHLATTPGIDDIAPVAGLGAPPPVPEPSSVLLLGTACCLVAWKFRKRSAAKSRS